MAMILVAAGSWEWIGWCVLMLVYFAMSFTALAIAYAGAGPRLFMKSVTGRRSWVAWVVFAPYFLLSHGLLILHSRVTSEPAYVQVLPNVFFGRRLFRHETAGVMWSSVLDLAAEFSASTDWNHYHSLPVLDATAPTEAELQSAFAWLADATQTGSVTRSVYVHCALGHGRSACVVIGYLLTLGVVQSVDEGVERLRSLRSGVRLHPEQVRVLQTLEAQLRSSIRPISTLSS
jgi:predicted protein tyrosine phosphatase